MNYCRFVSRLIWYRYIDINPQTELVMMAQMPALPCHSMIRASRKALGEQKSPAPPRHACFHIDYTYYPAGVWNRANSLPA